MNFTKQVKFLVNVMQLLLKLQDVISRMRVKFLKLFSGLLKGFLLVWLPCIIIF